MKLSIITVNLNNKDGLIKTVDSVLNQSFNDFEYIIIDGGSQDGSYEFILDLATKYPGLVWTSEPDTGVFNAMNKGIMKAKGNYLLFLNSGDYLVDKDVLASVFTNEQTSDILLGTARVSKNGKIVWIASPKSEYTLNDFFHGSLAHQAAFIRKDLFDKLGGYREDLRLMSDWEFFLRALIIKRCNLSPLDRVICDYNAEGMSSDKKNAATILHEKQVVYVDLGLDRIIPDYSEKDQWLEDHKPLLWAWSRISIRKPIEVLFRIASKRKN